MSEAKDRELRNASALLPLRTADLTVDHFEKSLTRLGVTESLRSIIIGAWWTYAKQATIDGDPPRGDVIAALLRAGDVPPHGRELAARYAEGTITFKPGRARPTAEESWRRHLAVDRVVRWQRWYRRVDRRSAGLSIDPFRMALERVSAELDVKESTLEKWVYPNGR